MSQFSKIDDFWKNLIRQTINDSERKNFLQHQISFFKLQEISAGACSFTKNDFFASSFAELLVNSNKHLLYEKKINELLQLFKTLART